MAHSNSRRILETAGKFYGRDERIIVAFQTSERDQVLIPANWEEGDDVLMKYVPYSDQELAANPDLADQYYKVGINMWYKKKDVK